MIKNIEFAENFKKDEVFIMISTKELREQLNGMINSSNVKTILCDPEFIKKALDFEHQLELAKTQK